MNDAKESQNGKLEKLLRKARLPESSPEVKDRITAEAIRVWNHTSVEQSWRIPFLRLAASAAAAVLVVCLANFTGDHSVARWKTSGPSVMRQQVPELEILPEMPYVKHLTAISRVLPATNGSGLRRYVETVRKLLDEVQQNDVSKPTAPIGGGSRLYPDRSRSSSCS